MYTAANDIPDLQCPGAQRGVRQLLCALGDRLFTSDRRTPHQPPAIGWIGQGAMDCTGVVPDDQIARRPTVLVDKSRLRGPFPQAGKNVGAFLGGLI